LEINRREFLKLLGVSSTAAAVGAWGANTIFSVPEEVFERINTGPHIETWKNSICSLCPGGCGIRVRQIDGIPVRIIGNNLYPVNRGGVCPKAEAGIEVMFHPERLRHPLKRKGERGENKWEKIDWDEALDIITNRLQKLRENGTPESLVLLTRDNNELITDLCRNFMSAFGSPNFLCLNDANIDSLPALISQGLNTTPFYDIGNTNYVLNFGADLLDEGPSPVRYNQLFAELKNRREQDRAKIVHISSYLSRTAANSTEWVAIKPGTMAALALAIAHVMIRDVSYDKKFIMDNSFGFSSWQDSLGKQHKGFKEMVTGEYYPEKVSKITGISAAKIIEIARDFASANPAFAVTNGQTKNSTNSMYTLWAIYCLNALKGNFEKRGGVLFPNQLDPVSLPDVTADAVTQSGLEKQKIGMDFKFVDSVDSIDQLLYALEKKQPYPIDTIFIRHVNTVIDSFDKERFESALKDVPLIVSSTSFLNETALYADLVLPEPIFLERWEASRDVPSVGFSHFGIQQPVIEPLYDTKHFGDVLLQLKQNLGGSIAEAFPWEDYISYLKSYAKDIFNSGQGTVISESMDLSWIEFLKERGWQAFEYSDFEEFWEILTERGGWWDPISLESKNTKIYNNNSGKFEFIAQTIMKKIDKQIKIAELQPEELEDIYRKWKIDARGDLIYLPHFEEPRFYDNNPSYPYHLLPYQMLSNYGYSAPGGLLNEISGLYSREYWNSWVEINPKTAARLKIDDGDQVRIISPKGEISLKVKIFPTVMPEIIMLPLCRSDYTSVKNPYALFSPDTDLMSNVPSLISTMVRIEKMNMKVST
jgi:anaerobic selenocysteine-containing dehydrogenase